MERCFGSRKGGCRNCQNRLEIGALAIPVTSTDADVLGLSRSGCLVCGMGSAGSGRICKESLPLDTGELDRVGTPVCLCSQLRDCYGSRRGGSFPELKYSAHWASSGRSMKTITE